MSHRRRGASPKTPETIRDDSERSASRAPGRRPLHPEPQGDETDEFPPLSMPRKGPPDRAAADLRRPGGPPDAVGGHRGQRRRLRLRPQQRPVTTLNTNDIEVRTDTSRAVGLIEFDLSGISPGTIITSATLTGHLTSAQYNSIDGSAAANFYGYTGDGQITLSDATAPDYLGSNTPIASFTYDTTTRELTSPIRTDFLQSIINSGAPQRFAGLHMRLARGEEFGIASTESSQFASPATLHLVFAGNSPPTARNNSYSTAEDTPLTVAAPGVLGNDSDVDGPALTAILISPPGHGSLTLNADGSFTYTPAANYNGPDSFSHKASDGQAGSSPATVSITISPVNDAPVARDDAYSTAQGTPLAVAAPGVLGNDSDVDSPAPTAILVAGPAHGTVALNADGSLTYTPAAGFSGADRFTYKANDGQADSNVATVSLTVNPVDRPPVAQTDPVALTEDGQASITLGGSDDHTPASALVFRVTSLPTRGVLSAGTIPVKLGDTFTGPPTLTYQAAVGLDDVGADGFDYTVTDSANQTTGGSVAVTVQKAVADGTAVLGADGVLRVGGTAGADTITVDLVKTRGRSVVQVTLGSTTIGTFSPSAVQEVRVWGREGNDRIDLSGMAVDAVLQGGSGDDTLTGGGSNVEFSGSAGTRSTAARTPTSSSATPTPTRSPATAATTSSSAASSPDFGRSTRPAASWPTGIPAATRRPRPT
jgi:VCBS repeat-containing protein